MKVPSADKGKGNRKGMVRDRGADPVEGLNEGKVQKCRCLNKSADHLKSILFIHG